MKIEERHYKIKKGSNKNRKKHYKIQKEVNENRKKNIIE